MTGAFEGATKAAIAEIIEAHTQESKFGYILSADGLQDLIGELYTLLQTSRSLKSAGDRILSGGPVSLAQSKFNGRDRR